MRLFPVVPLLAGLCLAPLHASILPVFHLEPGTVAAFNDYLAKFEKEVEAPFRQSSRLWYESQACCTARVGLEAGKIVVFPRVNADIAGGSIHHFAGAMHLSGARIEDIRRIMEDYPDYPKYFKPDVSKGSGALEPDSTPSDEHYTARLSLVQSTLWIDVSYDCVYDVHYLRFEPDHWEARSNSVSIREWRDPKRASSGMYPEGDDHGFLWRTSTYWFARESNGGVDLELDSITLSRPIPTGFGWWGTKRTRDAVDKMLRDMRAAVASLHG